MALRTYASLAHRRALNQTLIFSDGAPDQARLPPGKFVRALRSALRMSQGILAERSGVPQAQIARIESGRIEP